MTMSKNIGEEAGKDHQFVRKKIPRENPGVS